MRCGTRGIVIKQLLCVLFTLAITGAAVAQPRGPLAAYVYVEPFELRVEFVGRPSAFGFTGDADGAFGEAQQAAAADAVRQRLTGAFAVRVGDEALTLVPERFEFVRFDPSVGATVDPRPVIPGGDAWLAAVFYTERAGLPDAVTLTLDLFDDPRFAPPPSVPVGVQVLTPTWSESAELTFAAEASTQTWAVPDTGGGAGLVPVMGVARAAWRGPAAVAAGLVVLGIAAGGWGLRRATRRGPPLLVGGSLIALGLGVFISAAARGYAAPVNPAAARGVIEALLTNTYHAFAYRDESRIFDTLAASVDGPLLEKLYLDIQRTVGDAESGGPRVRVLDLDLRGCEVTAATSDLLRARVEWVSTGSVSHWGHTHRRQNRYRADVEVRPVDGQWRLTAVDVLDEERVG